MGGWDGRAFATALRIQAATNPSGEKRIPNNLEIGFDVRFFIFFMAATETCSACRSVELRTAHINENIYKYIQSDYGQCALTLIFAAGPRRLSHQTPGFKRNVLAEMV